MREDNIQPKLIETRTYAEPDGVSTKSLWDLVDRYRRHMLVKPPHQRALSWDEAKMRDWYVTLQTTSKLSVSFITYQLLEGDTWSATFLNDGGNRVGTSVRFYEDCESHGFAKGEAEMLLRSISIPVVHWHHSIWREAVAEFERANKGTGLTPYEANAYEWRYLGSHVPELVGDLHATMSKAEAALGINIQELRDSRHKYWRADMAMFLRYLDKEVSVLDYDVTGRVKDAPTIERRLREQIEKMSAAAFQEKVRQFARCIEEETALVGLEWKSYVDRHADNMTSGKRSMGRTVFRWCLDVGIMRRHLRLSVEEHRRWLSLFFEVSDGQAVFIVPGDRITISLERMSRMRALSEMIGCRDYGALIQRDSRKSRRKNGPRQRPGVANSHIEPFAHNGNGLTFPEPAVLNRARGAEPVLPEERVANSYV